MKKSVTNIQPTVLSPTSAMVKSSNLYKSIVDDINEAGGNFTLEDILNYEVDEVEPLQFEFLDYVGYVGPPPSSGAVLAFIVNIMARVIILFGSFGQFLVPRALVSSSKSSF